MKKVFKLIDLDCANCAAKMEDSINKLPEVEEAVVNYITQKMISETAQLCLTAAPKSLSPA